MCLGEEQTPPHAGGIAPAMEGDGRCDGRCDIEVRAGPLPAGHSNVTSPWICCLSSRSHGTCPWLADVAPISARKGLGRSHDTMMDDPVLGQVRRVSFGRVVTEGYVRYSRANSLT